MPIPSPHIRSVPASLALHPPYSLALQGFICPICMEAPYQGSGSVSLACPLPIPLQGFICPICMEALRSAEALQVHWEAAHTGSTSTSSAATAAPAATGDGGGGGAKGSAKRYV